MAPSADGLRAHAHPNTISRQASPGDGDADVTAPADRAPPSWEEDVTRPGDPSDLAVLASATIPSVVTQLPTAPPPPPAAVVLRAETDRTVVVRVPPRDQKRPMIVIGALTAACGFVAGYLVRGGSDAPASMRAAAAPTASIVRAHAVAPKRPAPPASPAPPQPAPAAAPPTCHARLTDAPDGATVRWGDVALGVTPLAGDLDVPCGDATVVLTHPRYERLERAVTATADAPAIVDADMKRPAATLELHSTPPGATFTVDGAAVDPNTPAKVHAFTRVTVVAALPGYTTATQHVSIKGPHDSLVVQLTPAPRRR
jgi:hypothetical protein